MNAESKKRQHVATDKAVSAADQVLGISPTGDSRLPTPGFGLPYGGLAPVEPPPTPDTGPRPPDSAMYSVPGTPIISGFLTDVTEYNPELQGRAAVLVYEKMRRGDGQVEAVLQALSLPILSAEWNVVADQQNQKAKGKNQKAKADEIAEFVKENLFGGLEFRTATGGWTSQSWHDVLRNALLSLAFGVSVHEDVYRVDGSKLRLRMLADLLPITFYRWHVDDDGRTLLYLGQYGYRGARFYQVSVPADKLCVFNMRREGANFWGRSILRPAYPHWYVKNQLYRIAAIGLERNHVGVPVITLSPGHSKEDQATAYNFVTQLAAHEKTGIVLPHGATFEIVGVKGMLTEKTMELMINHHNEQITVQALATFLNLGRTATGSRALGQTSTKFFMLAIQNVANLIAETITQMTIKRLVYYNFGEDAPCPRLVAANVQARALEDIIDAIQKLGQVGAFVADRPVRNKIRTELGLPEEVSEEITLPKSETIAGQSADSADSKSALSGPTKRDEDGLSG